MNTTIEQSTHNGINMQSQQQIIGLMSDQPTLAGITFKTSNTWSGATRTHSEFKTFTAAGQLHAHATTHIVESDLPELFLGTDQAATPAEYALHALASCMNSTMVYNCAARGISIRSSRVMIEGDLDARGFLRLDEAVAAGFSQVRIHFDVDTDAPAELIEDLIEGSPMFQTFAKPVTMDLSLTIQ